MVRIVKAKKGDRYNQGIHLWKPTQSQIEDAKETAWRDGFKTIYIHGERKKVVV